MSDQLAGHIRITDDGYAIGRVTDGVRKPVEFLASPDDPSGRNFTIIGGWPKERDALPGWDVIP